MPVPSTVADLSSTASSNYPSGSESIGTSLDDYLRAHASIIKQVSDAKADASTAVTLTGTQTLQNKTLDSTNNISGASGQLAGFRNKIINGGFSVNQRDYSSGAAVGAGLYGHDRWKMAASGDTYTYLTTANKTTVTIPAGKVLRQVIEGLNLQAGTYTLSWEGTAQGKIGSGSYGASGITGTIAGGADTQIEFGPGTVANVQLELGSIPTPFEHRPYGLELVLCQRYFQWLPISASFTAAAAGNVSGSAIPLKVSMRAVPSAGAGYVADPDMAQTNSNVTSYTVSLIGRDYVYGFLTAAGAGNSVYAGYRQALSIEL